MEAELNNLIKVWGSAIFSVSYCYFLSTRIKAGIFRFLFVLPVCAMFLVLPLFLSYVSLSLSTMFCLYVASLKLIQLSFDQGPLFPIPHNIFHFICFTCFPIRIRENPKSQNHVSKWGFAVEVVILAVLLPVYDHIQYIPTVALLILYALTLYLALEVSFSILKVLLTMTFGCHIEPNFNRPYLATSLQDFWGHRWNLIISDILRSTVYYPVRGVCKNFLDSEWSMIIGCLATFIVSGLGHEILFLFLTREMPTGNVTLFFVLQGVGIVAEMSLKKKKKNFSRRWLARPTVSRLVTVVFLSVTALWLYLPKVKRSNALERSAAEALLFIDFFKSKFLLSY